MIRCEESHADRQPLFGRGLSKSALGTVVSLFAEGYIVTVFSTQNGSPEALAREYAGSFDLVVCVGGDGTLSGVATGLVQLPSPPPFGLIPAGNGQRHRLHAVAPARPRGGCPGSSERASRPA